MKFPNGPSYSGGARRRRAGAFTLIEIMVAIGIFTMAVAAIYSTWTLILKSTQVGKEAAAQAQRRAIAIRLLEDALTSVQSYQASLSYYSFVVEGGDAPMLAFTAKVPDDFPRSARFGPDSSLRRLIFTLEPVTDPVTRTSENDLVLRQYPILIGIDPEEQSTPYVLARDVQKFKVECLDTNIGEWTDEWLETNSIPSFVRIDLVLGGRKSSVSGVVQAPLEIVRLVSMPSQMMPTSAQLPGRGGNPGGLGGPGGGRRPGRGGGNNGGGGGGGGGEP